MDVKGAVADWELLLKERPQLRAGRQGADVHRAGQETRQHQARPEDRQAGDVMLQLQPRRLMAGLRV